MLFFFEINYLCQKIIKNRQVNTFGRNFRISIFGESHGKSVGITIDGCPPGISLCEDDFLADLSRRKSGAKGTTPRKEPDLPEIISGTFNEKTTGAPITILFKNTNTRSKDYSNLVKIPRPGHADFTGKEKYKGFNDYRGGGHFSGRLTLAIVAAGVVAKKICKEISFIAKLVEVGGSENVEQAINDAVKKQDSVGGIAECTISGVPVGLGEPFFDATESVISHLVFSIPAIRGVEFGSGFESTKMTGSEHNDNIVNEVGGTETNNAGGINGGISNGNDIVFRVAIKPTSSISLGQETYDFENKQLTNLVIHGRHDLCIALRVPPVIEAAAAVAIADLLLTSKANEC